MSYDLYATHSCTCTNDVDHIINNGELDIPTRIALLAPALSSSAKDYARTGGKGSGNGYKGLVHAGAPAKPPYDNQTIYPEIQRLEQLGLWQPFVPDFVALPTYSAFLQFRFTLASPYISRDDEIFHINENSVRKDKVFKVPMMAGTGWKGNMRWTATHLMVLRWHETKIAEKLAEDRFRLSLLFGDEAGEVERKRLAEFLDGLSTEAASLYRRKVRAHFTLAENKPLPNHAGRLRFYPTFFNRIGLEVINPHDRKTRAGKQPIYFECVPAGDEGCFSLLYLPFEGVTQKEAKDDLGWVAKAIREMMQTYGFSAKKSSGFGEAENGIQGTISTATGKQPLNSLSDLEGVVTGIYPSQA